MEEVVLSTAESAVTESVPPKPKRTAKPKAAKLPETPEEKTARLERERERLLHDIAATSTDDLRAQIGYVLSQDPLARDSDVRLMHQVWQTFYPDLVEGEWVRFKEMYRLPRQTRIARTRATIQHDYGLFLPSAEVAKQRQIIRDETKAAVLADKPGPPVLTVHADESSQTGHRFTVIGSVWTLDISRVWRVARALDDYKAEHGINFEFKFADLNQKKLPLAQGFVKEAVKHAGLISLKACVLDTHGLGPAALSGDERLYRLYYELAMTGIEHEVKAGRVAPPARVPPREGRERRAGRLAAARGGAPSQGAVCRVLRWGGPGGADHDRALARVVAPAVGRSVRGERGPQVQPARRGPERKGRLRGLLRVGVGLRFRHGWTGQNRLRLHPPAHVAGAGIGSCGVPARTPRNAPPSGSCGSRRLP